MLCPAGLQVAEQAQALADLKAQLDSNKQELTLVKVRTRGVGA